MPFLKLSHYAASLHLPFWMQTGDEKTVKVWIQWRKAKHSATLGRCELRKESKVARQIAISGWKMKDSGISWSSYAPTPCRSVQSERHWMQRVCNEHWESWRILYPRSFSCLCAEPVGTRKWLEMEGRSVRGQGTWMRRHLPSSSSSPSAAQP